MRHSVIKKAAVAALTVALSASLVMADDDDDDDDDGGQEPRTVVVDCDEPDQSITRALQKAPLDRPLIIEILGQCRENVTIQRNNVTLRGTDPANSQIIGVPETDPTRESPVTLQGAQEITLEKLTVTNGTSSGIAATASFFEVTDCVIEGNGFNGIFVGTGALGLINGNVIRDNVRDGVAAQFGGFAEIIDNTIENNRNGVGVSRNGSALIGQDLLGNAGPNLIANNREDGILIFAEGSALIAGNTVRANNTGGAGDGGIAVSRAEATLIGGNQIEQNNGLGILVLQGVLRMVSSTADNIANNSDDGILAINASSIELRGPTTVTQNGGDGISLFESSFLRIGRGAQVTNNTGNGLRLGRDSGVFFPPFFPPAATVSGNPGGDLVCLDTESSASGDLSGVGTLACTGF